MLDVKEEVDLITFLRLTVTEEKSDQNSEISIIQKNKDMSEVLLKKLHIKWEEMPQFAMLLSETHTNINKIMNALLLLKVYTLDNISTVVKKLLYKPEMFYLLVKFQKVLQFVTLKKKLVIKDMLPEALVLTELLPLIKKMEEPELNYQAVLEKPMMETAELWLVLLPVVVETKNQS